MWKTILTIFLVIVVVLGTIGMASDGLAAILLFLQKKLGFPRNVKTGIENLIGQTATVTSPFEECENGIEGKIRLNGEIWSARSECQTRFANGTQVRVNRVEGLVAYVENLSES